MTVAELIDELVGLGVEAYDKEVELDTGSDTVPVIDVYLRRDGIVNAVGGSETET